MSLESSIARQRDDVFDKAAEVVFWLRIATSPVLACALIGAFLYLSVGCEAGVVLLTRFIVLGVVLGSAFAEWARRKHGTVNFYSTSENLTPDIDDFVKHAEKER